MGYWRGWHYTISFINESATPQDPNQMHSDLSFPQRTPYILLFSTLIFGIVHLAVAQFLPCYHTTFREAYGMPSSVHPSQVKRAIFLLVLWVRWPAQGHGAGFDCCPKVIWCAHQSHTDAFHILTPYFFNIHFNILPPMIRSPKWSLSQTHPIKLLLNLSFLRHVIYTRNLWL
jgi:hypothetical protein